MATTYVHTRMSVVDSSANVKVLYPETTGADVTVSRASNTNIPSSVTTAQDLANVLAASAFAVPIDDSSTTSTTKGWSASKLNTQITAINSNVYGKAPKSHAVNANTYGLGTASVYGHVKLNDTYTSKVSGGNAAGSIGASQNALYNAYNTVNSKLPFSLAINSGVYGYKTTSNEFVGFATGSDISWYISHGWLPEIPEGDLPATLELCSWQEISQHAKANTLKNYFSVGDSKTLTLSNGDVMVMQIADFNHDGNTGSVDFISQDCMTDGKQMNTSNTNSGGWNNCLMRSYLNSTVLGYIPTSCRNYIVSKTLKRSNGSQQTSLVEATDKIWLPTEFEIFGRITYSASTEAPYQSQYPVFPAKGYIKHYKNASGAVCSWWESSPYVGDSTSFCAVYTSGAAAHSHTSTSHGVPLCFRM